MSHVNGLKHVQLLILSPGKWGVSPFGCLEPKVRKLEKHTNLNGVLKIPISDCCRFRFGFRKYVYTLVYQTRLESVFKFCFSLFIKTQLNFSNLTTHTFVYTVWGLKTMLKKVLKMGFKYKKVLNMPLVDVMPTNRSEIIRLLKPTITFRHLDCVFQLIGTFPAGNLL